MITAKQTEHLNFKNEIYIYVYTYTYIYTHTHTHTHTHIYIYIYVYTHTYQDRLSVSAETGKEGQWTVAKRQESAGTYSM